MSAEAGYTPDIPKKAPSALQRIKSIFSFRPTDDMMPVWLQRSLASLNGSVPPLSEKPLEPKAEPDKHPVRSPDHTNSAA